MQLDFHYYATYCAACLAGYSHPESLDIAYAAQFVDCCSRDLLKKLGAPASAATTQLQAELMNEHSDPVSLQNITRIWASFHFLPYDLYAVLPWRPRVYMNKYRLICRPNGALLQDTVELAQSGSLQAAGIAMHVLADTWAHSNFAGTPSNVINNINSYFYELPADGGEARKVRFRHNPTAADDLENSRYSASLHRESESSIMNLGHGRAGHIPDYCFLRYEYLPAWKDYETIRKDNPADYLQAFRQMVYALKCLRSGSSFRTGCYDSDAVAPWESEIRSLLEKRQPNAEADWKALGEKISGCPIRPFDIGQYQEEYRSAREDRQHETFLGRFFLAAQAQKHMVTEKIFRSGNLLAGFPADKRLSVFQKFRKHAGGDPV